MTTAQRVMSPRREDLATLIPSLTEGEALVVDFFDELLPASWEIYTQPFMNSVRPDLVVLNERVGIGVFEVKDWAVGTLAYQARHGRDDPLLHEQGPGGGKSNKRSPLAQVRQYRDEIAELYCPALSGPSGIAAVTGGVIFTKMTTDEAHSLLDSELARVGPNQRPYLPISGRDLLEARDLSRLFPTTNWSKSQLMTPEIAVDLRRWLVEPEHARAQRSPLPLDAHQRELATTRTASGYRRIRGPAGSGKSLVLAQRAAELVREGSNVLIVSFNHTLRNYLGDLVVRAGAKRTSITWLGFHEWCKRTMRQAGRESEYEDLAARLAAGHDTARILETEMAERTLEALNTGAFAADVPRYDVILVDEGQDFRLEWWSALRAVVRDGGEMLLVADRAQDIYERSEAWTENAMIGAGFPGGRWGELDLSYRLPVELVRLLHRFHHEFLPESDEGPPKAAVQDELPLLRLRWRQVAPDAIATGLVEELVEVVAHGSFSDVCVIVDTKAAALAAIDELQRRNITCLHTIADDSRAERRLKHAFFRGDARVKVTTIHSFKGWESSRLLIAITEDSPQLAYTALTRLLRSDDGASLTVICANPRFRDFGSSWPIFEETA